MKNIQTFRTTGVRVYSKRLEIVKAFTSPIIHISKKILPSNSSAIVAFGVYLCLI